jgi:parallel beta-helix repeat protein
MLKVLSLVSILMFIPINISYAQFLSTPNISLKKPTLGLNLPLSDINNPARQFNDNLDILDRKFSSNVSTLSSGGDFTTLEAAVLSLCPTGDTSPEKTLIIPVVTAVAANTTVCKPLTLEFTGSGRIDPATTVVVTVNGPWIASLKQVIQCVGSEACVVFSPREVSIAWFGVVIGSSDSTNAIQASMDSLTAGGTVVVPENNYSFTAITYNFDNLTVRGESWKSSLSVLSNAAPRAIDGTLTRTNIWLKNIKINWNVTGVPVNLFDLDNATDSGAEHVFVQGLTTLTAISQALRAQPGTRISYINNTLVDVNADNIRPASCTGCKVIGNTMRNIKRRDGVFDNRAVLGGGSTDLIISGNVIEDILDTTGDGVYALDVGGASRVVISGNVISNAWGGLDVEDSHYVQITGNTFSGAGGAATNGLQGQFGIFFNASVSDSEHIVISGNTFRDFQVGVDIGFGRNVTITGNTISGSYRESINSRLTSTATNLTITGNTFKGNDVSGADQAFDLQMDNINSETFLVSGNTFIETRLMRIRVVTAATKPAIFTNNVFTTSAHADISLTGPIYVDNNILGSGIVQTFTDQDASPLVAGLNKFKTANTIATTITSFDLGNVGQEIEVLFGDSLTTINETGNIKLISTFRSSIDDILSFTFDGTNWVETSRGIDRLPDSVNILNYADFAAAVTAIGSSVKTLIIPTVTASIVSNVTVPSTLTLEFTGSGQLNVGSVTLPVLTSTEYGTLEFTTTSLIRTSGSWITDNYNVADATVTITGSVAGAPTLNATEHTTIAFSDAEGVMTVTRIIGSWITDGYNVDGVGVVFTNTTSGLNNKTCQVVSATALVLTVDHCRLVTQAALAAVTVSGRTNNQTCGVESATATILTVDRECLLDTETASTAETINGQDPWTVTVNGPFECPDLKQCISGAGRVAGLKRVTPQWFGALADGTADDAPEIQKAINASSVIEWPCGNYKIASTLNFPTTAPYASGRWIGCGAFINDPRTTTRTTQSTIITWDGPLGGTMLESERTVGFTFEHMTFVGRVLEANTNRAGIGFHCIGGVGLSSGTSRFESVEFIDMTVGIQMAVDSGDPNCDTMIYNHLTFINLDVGFLGKNIQTLQHIFTNLAAVTVKSVLWFEQSATVTLNTANFSLSGGTGANDWMIRFDNMTNNSDYAIINGLRIEQNSKQLLRAATLGTVTFNGFVESQADQNVEMVDIDGVSVTFNDSRLLTNDATTPFFNIQHGAGTQRASIHIDNSRFETTAFVFDDWFNLSDTNDDVGITVHNSGYGSQKIELPDINSHMEWGRVTHFTQTTNSTLKALLLNGSATSSVSNIVGIANNSTYLVDVFIVGRQVGGTNIATFHRRVTVSNNAGTTALVGAIQTVGTDQNTPVWTVDVVAVDSLDGIRAQVTGAAAATVEWKAIFIGTPVIE